MTRISVKRQLLAAARKEMGKRIQARRQDAGLTQAELGRELGVEQEAVSRWEAGLVEIGTDDLRTLGKVLQAHTGWFMEGMAPDPKPYVAPARRAKTGLPIEEGAEKPRKRRKGKPSRA